MQKEKLFSRSWLISYGYIVFGSILFAAGDVFFVNPYKLAPGGVYGIANILYHTFGVKISVAALCMEVPLLIFGTWILGPKFGVKTIISIVLIAGSVYFFEAWHGYEALIPGDIVINTIIAGILYGVAIGLIFKSHATSGGTDIISMVLSKYTRISLGRMVLMVDSTVALASLVCGDFRLPIYSVILIFISSKIIDMIIDGIKTYKTAMIISEKPELIKDVILNKVGRGGTCWEATGMYSGKTRCLLYTVIDRRELINLRDEIAEIDPMAFINVIDSSEIMGEGFKKLQKSQI